MKPGEAAWGKATFPSSDDNPPRYGGQAPDTLLGIFLHEEAGWTMDESQNLLSGGMLVTTMIGLRMTDEFDLDQKARVLLPEKLHVKLSPRECSAAEAEERGA